MIKMVTFCYYYHHYYYINNHCLLLLLLLLLQVKRLFPSASDLECTWWNVVKLGKSLYKEAPGMDVNRPSQVTAIPNFFLAGSYTIQDYLDSMERATKSGLICADSILARTEELQSYRTSVLSSTSSVGSGV